MFRTVRRCVRRAALKNRFSSTVDGAPSADAEGVPSTKKLTKWERMMKYKMLGVPVLIAVVVATDIINKENHRLVLEEYCPWFGMWVH
jgi:hypothetical protein